MKIRVSMTSWRKRIDKINLTLDTILNQNLTPDSIELNFAEEEFPNREQDFPEHILKYLNEHSNIIHCNWVFKNTRTFKKIIPTIEKYFGEEYYLLSIDDDCFYRNDYIRIMIDCIEEFGGDSFCLSRSLIIGNRQIYKASCFDKDFIEKLTDEVISYGIDDSYIQHYLQCKGKIMTHYRPDNILDIIQFHDEDAPLHDEYRKDNRIQKAITAIKKIKF